MWREPPRWIEETHGRGFLSCMSASPAISRGSRLGKLDDQVKAPTSIQIRTGSTGGLLQLEWNITGSILLARWGACAIGGRRVRRTEDSLQKTALKPCTCIVSNPRRKSSGRGYRVYCCTRIRYCRPNGIHSELGVWRFAVVLGQCTCGGRRQVKCVSALGYPQVSKYPCNVGRS